MVMAEKETTSTPWLTVWFWVLVGGAIVLVGLVAYSQTFNNLIESITNWAGNLMEANPVLGALVFLLFSAISAMLAFASSTVLVPAGNLVWGKPITFMLLWGGWVLGAFAAYGIGRLARPLLRRLGYGPKLKEYEQYVSSRMRFWAVLVFCLAVPSEIPGYVFGGLQYPFWKFISAMAIAEAVYALGVVIAGESLLAANPLTLFATIAVMVFILVGATLALRRLKKRKSK